MTNLGYIALLEDIYIDLHVQKQNVQWFYLNIFEHFKSKKVVILVVIVVGYQQYLILTWQYPNNVFFLA